ncbi:MAG: glycoside hydrolase family 130 protein [Myxococcales bacterium]|nr:MAG: glycoside hydrolase family 130 protein [Myxococcales bacterium]
MPSTSEPLRLTRTPHRLLPDPTRVITRPFHPSDVEIASGEASRIRAILDRVLAIPTEDLPAILERLWREFSSRHRDFERVLDEHYRLVSIHLDLDEPLSRERRLLIGAYFTHEYSIEGAALFNPSIVPAPDQSGLPPGALRFVMSTRAVGEGHISSIGFRVGVIGPAGEMVFDPTSPFAFTGARTPNPAYVKRLFAEKLREVGVDNEVSRRVLARVQERFSTEDLHAACAASKAERVPAVLRCKTLDVIHWLATSSYDVVFQPDSSISERVIFPEGPNESHGMEDARFVRFVEKDGSVSYYATYTAYDGHDILPQLIETADFLHFGVRTLSGSCVQNKGMALFPRRIGGKFAMLSRHDGESLYFLTSDNVRSWSEAKELHVPSNPWEIVQIGNCGSPIETEAGWLVLTHGVGAMRCYAIGALLLDLDDPQRIIGQLAEPLLVPAADEREGYVPNVVYTCGGIVHEGQLVLPYGFSDVGIGIATTPMDELMSRLRDGSAA